MNAPTEVLGAPQLAIIVPCFNEEEVLPETERRLSDVLRRLVAAGKIASSSHICFVDDGSNDRTWPIIADMSRTHPAIGGIRLSRNMGHQAALMAGLFAADADLTISIDADLQDDVEAIPKMVDAAHAGADVVFGVRKERGTDTASKRITARAYYRLLAMMGVEVVYDHADFRLLSRQPLEALKLYGERNLFLRALIPQLGFRTEVVYYERAKRMAGISKYPFSKMLALAIEGITSFSTRPLRLVTLLGILLSFLSAVLAIWAIGGTILGTTVPGWASTVIPIYIVCGVQLFSLGIIGEYIGKIYVETKARPRFIVADSLMASSVALDPDRVERSATPSIAASV